MEMTMKLVKKDFVYLACSLKRTLVFALGLSVSLSLLGIGYGITMPALTSYILFYSLFAFGERSKSIFLTMSLPITRKALCLTYYIEVAIYIFITTLLSLLGVMLSLSFKGMNYLNLIGYMLGIAMIYSGIFIPCMLRFGSMSGRYIIVVIYTLTFSVAAIVNRVGAIQVKNELARLEIVGRLGVVGFILIGICIWMISYLISSRILRNKSFK